MLLSCLSQSGACWARCQANQPTYPHQDKKELEGGASLLPLPVFLPFLLLLALGLEVWGLCTVAADCLGQCYMLGEGGSVRHVVDSVHKQGERCHSCVYSQQGGLWRGAQWLQLGSDYSLS